MRVVRLARTPVKGCRQHGVPAAEVTASGLAGDRTHLFVSGREALRTVAHPALLALACMVSDGRVTLTLPDGRTVTQDAAARGEAFPVDYWGRGLPARSIPGPVSDAAAAYLGRDAVLAELVPPHRAIYAEPVSVLFLSELDALPSGLRDPGRFRANVVVDDRGEAASVRVGEELRVGDVVLSPVQRLERCGLVDFAPGTADRDAAVFAELPRTDGRRLLAWGCAVVRAGRVHVGDLVDAT